MNDVDNKEEKQENLEQSDDKADEAMKQGNDEERKEYRKHRLSTGVLIIWLVATAVLSIVIGGFAGAIIQKSTDERNFEIERNSLNEKISTLESSAEETQAELAELRELRKKLEDLMTEYMILDTQRQAANVAAENASLLDENDTPVPNAENAPTVDGKTTDTTNSTVKPNSSAKEDEEEPGGLFEWLMGTDKSENENVSSNTKNKTTNVPIQGEK